MFKVSKRPYRSLNKIGSFASGATTHLVVKSGTKCLKSEIMDRFWCSRCQNDHINLPKKIGSFASGATIRLVVKNGTKSIKSEIMDGFWWLRCLNDRIPQPDIIGTIADETTDPLVAKKLTKIFFFHTFKFQ